MGIRKVQKDRIVNEATRTLYATGEQPTVNDILKIVQDYLTKNPLGNPLRFSSTSYAQPRTKSNTNRLNDVFLRTLFNLDVAYESAEDMASQIMFLNTFLKENLSKLTARRKVIESRIDDYLFASLNSDGYFYSFSDDFSTIDYTDLSLTSALIDQETGVVLIPENSDLTNRIGVEKVRGVELSALVDGKQTTFVTKSPFSNCVDGLSNTVWGMEVITKNKAEVILSVSVSLGTNEQPVTVSRVEYDPYGITPVQVWVTTYGNFDDNGAQKIDVASFVDPRYPDSSLIRSGENFGGRIQLLDAKGVFTDNGRECKTVNLTLRKTDPDYTTVDNGAISYHYMFGAKNLAISEHVYDNDCIWVSTPITIPTELSEDMIDAVSLVTKAETPNDCSIQYYVAQDIESTTQPTLSDFVWKEIYPLDDTSYQASNIVRFEGANRVSRQIAAEPQSADWQLIPLASTGQDDKLNPAPVFQSDPTDYYRIAEMKDEFILNSLSLEEGINTLRVLHKDTELTPGTGAVKGMDLAYWADYVSGVNTAINQVYVRLDESNTFFDGTEVGEDLQSVYAETYLEVQNDLEVLLKRFTKVDSGAKTWDVKVFLNGRQVADLPVGTDDAMIPWKFNRGLNHIILLITIPASEDESTPLYQGQIDLMSPDKLYDWGTVKLGTWYYVDPFVLRFNEQDGSRAFTIYEREIEGGVVKKELISRRKPTDNLRIQFNKPSGNAPSGVRLRADLKRTRTNRHVSPRLDLYRLRFLYGA